MSEPQDQETVAAESYEDAEVVDALPVPEPGEVGAGAGAAARSVPAAVADAARGGARGLVIGAPVAVQAAAVGVTAFAAGAATVAVVRHRRGRKAGRRALSRRTKAGDSVLATRSFLVDVHFLGRD
ncbi:hypothetical protein [Conexibacter woesei]|uniref:hypothetical protein n=1 Tax=Conexibacter woesei TaxID=191495 RepID=UPI0012DCD8A8|nr:hypothetical protein [Conexibacter woesei]